MTPLIGWIQLLAATAATANKELSWRDQQFRSMHQHFATPDPLIYRNLAVGFFAVIAIYLVIKVLAVVQRRQNEDAKAQPYSLFMRVQAQLALPLFDRWCLWRMARSIGLANPAAILISPVLFDQAIEQYRPGSGRRARLDAIRARLFGGNSYQLSALSRSECSC